MGADDTGSYPPLPEGWKATRRQGSNKFIFCDLNSSRGSYAHPVTGLEYPVPAARSAPNTPKPKSGLKVTFGTASAVPPFPSLPLGWTFGQTPNGDYFFRKTNDSQGTRRHPVDGMMYSKDGVIEQPLEQRRLSSLPAGKLVVHSNHHQTEPFANLGTKTPIKHTGSQSRSPQLLNSFQPTQPPQSQHTLQPPQPSSVTPSNPQGKASTALTSSQPTTHAQPASQGLQRMAASTPGYPLFNPQAAGLSLTNGMSPSAQPPTQPSAQPSTATFAPQIPYQSGTTFAPYFTGSFFQTIPKDPPALTEPAQPVQEGRDTLRWMQETARKWKTPPTSSPSAPSSHNMPSASGSVPPETEQRPSFPVPPTDRPAVPGTKQEGQIPATTMSSFTPISFGMTGAIGPLQSLDSLHTLNDDPAFQRLSAATAASIVNQASSPDASPTLALTSAFQRLEAASRQLQNQQIMHQQQLLQGQPIPAQQPEVPEKPGVPPSAPLALEASASERPLPVRPGMMPPTGTEGPKVTNTPAVPSAFTPVSALPTQTDKSDSRPAAPKPQAESSFTSQPSSALHRAASLQAKPPYYQQQQPSQQQRQEQYQQQGPEQFQQQRPEQYQQQRPEQFQQQRQEQPHQQLQQQQQQQLHRQQQQFQPPAQQQQQQQLQDFQRQPRQQQSRQQLPDRAMSAHAQDPPEAPLPGWLAEQPTKPTHTIQPAKSAPRSSSLKKTKEALRLKYGIAPPPEDNSPPTPINSIQSLSSLRPPGAGHQPQTPSPLSLHLSDTSSPMAASRYIESLALSTPSTRQEWSPPSRARIARAVAPPPTPPLPAANSDLAFVYPALTPRFLRYTDRNPDPAPHLNGGIKESPPEPRRNPKFGMPGAGPGVTQWLDATLPPLKDGSLFSPPAGEPATRHRYNLATKEWIQTPALVRIDLFPFQQGTMRHVYHMKDLSQPPGPCQDYVAKFSRDPNENADEYYLDCKMQATVAFLAKHWNRIQRIKQVGNPVALLEASVIELHDRIGPPGRKVFCSCEPYLPGKFVKVLNNFGWVNPNAAQFKMAIAFGHWTYHYTDGKVLVCDIQGVLQQDGMDWLTDPQIHSLPGRTPYGKSDMRQQGFEKFFQSHQCNEICRALKLTSYVHKVEIPETSFPDEHRSWSSVIQRADSVSAPSVIAATDISMESLPTSSRAFNRSSSAPASLFDQPTSQYDFSEDWQSAPRLKSSPIPRSSSSLVVSHMASIPSALAGASVYSPSLSPQVPMYHASTLPSSSSHFYLPVQQYSSAGWSTLWT